MIKKILLAVGMLFTAIAVNAQTPLPLNPNVKHGTLSNGLNYYILHNEEPKERVNFYIAQKVGSTLETPEQLGLAHFLEHMAFNGTTHYPGKTMLNYLQSKGIRFGADINAYTAFDETVYNINNVPSSDKALVDSVLLVLYDWSGGILLEESEINAERGVIEEEWRSRNSAQQRQWEAMLPKVFQEPQYQTMVIGDINIIRTFPPQVIRDYYKKWYRPDQQGIVIVGDIDAEEMEKKVVALFSDIPMPENAAPRIYPSVSDNKEPIYFYFQDKELQVPRVTVSFKSEKTPFEMRNTMENYVGTNIVENLISTMINNRLEEFSHKPECRYAYAGVWFGDFYVAATKSAFNISAIAKDDVVGAYDDALAIVAQACKTGFMESEIVRARDEMIANYEKAYNERNTTTSEDLARELCRHFTENDPAPGIEMEYQMVQALLPQIPVQMINESCKEMLTADNQVIVVSQPEKEGTTAIDGALMTGKLTDALNKTYEAYVDEVITDPLIENLPAPGKVVSAESGEFGTTVFTLSNGVKVVVKPTDFKSDEILFAATRDGGRQMYEVADSANVVLISEAFETSKLGNFDRVKLSKYLAGKNVSLGYDIARKATSLEGASTVKDLPTFMELLYATFTSLNADTDAFSNQMNRNRAMLKNVDSNPQSVFNRHVTSASYGNNPLFATPTVAMVDAANYDRMLQIINTSMENAADYTMFFTGNVDVNTLQPLLEKYVATLPSKGVKDDVKAVTPVTTVTGIVEDDFRQTMQVPSTMVYVTLSDTNVPFNVENSTKINLIGSILRNIYTDTLREEEGGTYSPYAMASLNPYFGQWQITYVFQTNAEMQQKLMNRAEEELVKLLTNGADEVNFTKAKEAAAKQYEINSRTNEYWNANIMMLDKGFDNISNAQEAISNLTLDDFNAFMKNLYNGKNKISVVMEGVAE